MLICEFISQREKLDVDVGFLTSDWTIDNSLQSQFLVALDVASFRQMSLIPAESCCVSLFYPLSPGEPTGCFVMPHVQTCDSEAGKRGPVASYPLSLFRDCNHLTLPGNMTFSICRSELFSSRHHRRRNWRASGIFYRVLIPIRRPTPAVIRLNMNLARHRLPDDPLLRLSTSSGVSIAAFCGRYVCKVLAIACKVSIIAI